MATPLTSSSPKKDIPYFASGVGRGFGRGRGLPHRSARGRGRGRGIFSKTRRLPVESPQGNGTTFHGITTNSTITSSTTASPAKQLQSREAFTTEQFADAFPGHGDAQEQKQHLEPVPAATAQTCSPYEVIMTGFEQAVDSRQPELALKLAACLSYSLPGTQQAFTTEERKRLKTSYRKLEQSLQSEHREEQAQKHQQLLQALITRIVSAHCTTTEQINHSRCMISDARPSQTGRHIDEQINALEQHLAKGEISDAATCLKTLSLVFRMLHNKEQYMRIKDSAQALIPKLYEQAKTYSNPQDAVDFLRTYLFPIVDFIHTEKPRPESEPDANISQYQLMGWLSAYFDRNNDMTTADLFSWKLLVRFLANNYHLLKRQSKELHYLLLERTPEVTGTQNDKIATPIKQLLRQGKSKEALQKCQAISTQTPEIWTGHKAAALNHVFKCSLRAELASLCFEAEQAQELTLQHCQQLNALFSLLRSMKYVTTGELLWDQPWLTGGSNCNILFILRYLFNTLVLQPRWDTIACETSDSKIINQTTIDQLQQMIDDYGELLYPSHTQQLESLKASLPKTKMPQGSAAQPANQQIAAHPVPETATAPELPAKPWNRTELRRAAVDSVGEDVIKEFYTLSPDRSEHPEVNEQTLKTMLASIEKVKIFALNILKSHLENQKLAQAWVDFIQHYCLAHPELSFIAPYKRKALQFLVSAAVDVQIQNAFARFRLCDDDPEQKKEACGQVARHFAEHIYPLTNFISGNCVSNYQKLMQVIHGNFLRYLGGNTFTTPANEINDNAEAVAQACEEVYPYLMLFNHNTQGLLRKFYTQCAYSKLQRALDNLSSDNDRHFKEGLNQLVDDVYEKHNFFSWEQTPKTCRIAKRATIQAYRGLRTKALADPAQWQSLFDKFKDKHKQARFLNIFAGEQEYYPPDNMPGSS